MIKMAEQNKKRNIEMERILLQMQILQPAVRLVYLNNGGFPLLQTLIGMTQQFNDLGMGIFKNLSVSKGDDRLNWNKMLNAIEKQRYILICDICKVAEQIRLEYKPKE